ncbi:MAG: carbamoyltransferase HypF [Planctomycetes bacterium]|nr:carbamoyltransferase HypF [Planctomycetota bacterium]
MERRVIAVRGIVQGVGFRPFVHHLAERLCLAGFVRNEPGGVSIEIEGELPALDIFLSELTASPPPLALIERLEWRRCPPRGAERFHIQPSPVAGPSQVFVSPDVATCTACLGELFDPNDRRFGHPFLNCTDCGPRLTIVTGAPYDRQRTTMAGFAMCSQCRSEYEDPASRRFHAQPTCCPACGPRLQRLDARGRPLPSGDPLVDLAADLRRGLIAAIKGLGGYHLACDARQSRSVTELRQRKQRDEKPFAVMVPDLAAVAALCCIEPAERELLVSPSRPIVLLRKRAHADVAEELAPGNPFLGVMLPYTPVHHLLLRQVGGTPLVMTSGNRSDEPIARDDDDAVRRLSGIADRYLTHDRAIHVRCDDSVTRVVAGTELPLRRSRGHAPRPIPLPVECHLPALAVGGQLKGTFALGRGRHAFLSHHLGDLDHYQAYRAMVHDVDLYMELFDLVPKVLVHDAHPEYASTRFARAWAERDPAVQLLAVQHHHAHVASCMAENGLDEPVIGVAFDGTGYGDDGTIWGGEFLVGDYQCFRRAAHLRCVGMPGGDLAIKQPWRMALAHLLAADCAALCWLQRQSPATLRAATQQLDRGVNSPLTSSMGRLFDAVASLIGVRDQVSYEGQAAMQLEWLAETGAADRVYPFVLAPAAGVAVEDRPLVIDTRPLIRAIAGDLQDGVATANIARQFHMTIAGMIAAVCDRLRKETGLDTVALSGGVFMNALLLCETCERLRDRGFQVHRHRLVPPGDGGLCLGQLAIAARTVAAS